jgi:hypothetical protein
MGSKIKYSIATSLVKTISTILSDRMVGLGTVAYLFLQGGSFIKKKKYLPISKYVTGTTK